MKFAIEIILLALIAIGAAVWQYYLIEKDSDKDDPPLRVIIPLVMGIVSIVGLIVHGLVAIFADNNISNNYGWSDMFANLGRAIVLFISFTVKSYLGPIFVGLTLIMLTYFYFEYSEVKIWKFMEVFFEWIFSAMPKWVEAIYLLTLYIVALGGSLYDGNVD